MNPLLSNVCPGGFVKRFSPFKYTSVVKKKKPIAYIISTTAVRPRKSFMLERTAPVGEIKTKQSGGTVAQTRR